jgi:hypothetical protein
MGSLLMFDGTPRVVPLAPVTLVGRGAACHARLTHPGAPTHWLEVRWLGEGWGWRALAAEDATRGPNTLAAAGWRRLGPQGRHPPANRHPRVSLGEHAWVELADPSPPAPFVWDLVRGSPLQDVVVERHFEARPGTLLPLDDIPRAAPFTDGQVLALHDTVMGPLAVRLHLPDAVPATLDTVLDLLHPGISLDVDLDTLVAAFHQRDAVVTVRGECVRVLAVYLAARTRDLPRGGWLTPAEGWAAWVALGGNPRSESDRLSWERGKLRTQLARLQVANVHALFELSRQGDTIRTRLGIDLRTL